MVINCVVTSLMCWLKIIRRNIGVILNCKSQLWIVFSRWTETCEELKEWKSTKDTMFIQKQTSWVLLKHYLSPRNSLYDGRLMSSKWVLEISSKCNEMQGFYGSPFDISSQPPVKKDRFDLNPLRWLVCHLSISTTF